MASWPIRSLRYNCNLYENTDPVLLSHQGYVPVTHDWTIDRTEQRTSLDNSTGDLQDLIRKNNRYIQDIGPIEDKTNV